MPGFSVLWWQNQDAAVTFLSSDNSILVLSSASKPIFVHCSAVLLCICQCLVVYWECMVFVFFKRWIYICIISPKPFSDPSRSLLDIFMLFFYNTRKGHFSARCHFIGSSPLFDIFSLFEEVQNDSWYRWVWSHPWYTDLIHKSIFFCFSLFPIWQKC